MYCIQRHVQRSTSGYIHDDIAIKKLKADIDKKFLKEFKRELATMLRIRPHPNLVNLIGVCNDDGHLILVTEYCEGGTLFSLLHKNRSTQISMKQKKKILTDVARGMIFLHENNTPVIHRDLKSLKYIYMNQSAFRLPILSGNRD